MPSREDIIEESKLDCFSLGPNNILYFLDTQVKNRKKTKSRQIKDLYIDSIKDSIVDKYIDV